MNNCFYVIVPTCGLPSAAGIIAHVNNHRGINMRHRGGFLSPGEAKRRKNVSLINQRRWKRKSQCLPTIAEEKEGLFEEHSFCAKANVSVHQPNLNHVVAEEVIGCDSDEEECDPQSDSWKEGRRIVELKCLVDGLSACCHCMMPLSLTTDTIIRETKLGLGGFLHVQCSNPACQFINKIALGKRHKSGSDAHAKTWDVNCKAASGKL